MGKKCRRLPTEVSRLAASLTIEADKPLPGIEGELMRFLFRLVLWPTIVLILLPSVGSQPSVTSFVSASDALSAAKATVTDARSFCDRQADACSIGMQAARALGHRAQAGARMLYDYLKDQFGADDGDVAKSSPGKSTTQASGGVSRDTLMPADLVAPWRGPRGRKEVRLERQ
jgi:Family of unknown function (DUF5330)